jgi:hypothetical protein
MKLIPLTQGKFAMVDDADFDYIGQWKWRAIKDHKKDNYRAVREEKNRTIYIHRQIMNSPNGMDVDHCNHNGLDNQRNNLRICTHAENLRNQLPQQRRNKTSKYKGVSRWAGIVKDGRHCYAMWVTQIKKNSKTVWKRYFRNEEDAARAYNEKAKEVHGKYACLNIGC